ncbi:MAG: SDR family NAD(P)-dependent oxidoreductase [Verrucomicrobiales bacterium]
MPSPVSKSSVSSPAKEALAKIRELKQKLAEAEGPQDEPIAIVSTACRFPRRSSSPEAFWRSLVEGTDEVTELPPDRWDLDAYFDEDPDAPGKMYARKGTFLESIDEMDADFFGISPREATWIDPQQRLFLEVSWEALERAGWTSEKGSKDTGVFVGWMHNDYQNEASESLLDLNPYIATGSAGSFLCGRLSYYLGTQGPSLAVDTACSSSLVALHLACQSLRQGECDRALAGGVNIMVSPKTTIMTCKLHALSPSGHSRAFDASADGYLRGEGCGAVALRRLSDAVRDGDPVLAVVRGSAITHNGFSSGLTAPNPASQQRVIRRALEQAKVSPSEIGYLEAHGTGTELGDPVEMNAAAAVLGEGRDAGNPLLVGSVKTNLGHLEAAAGIAGIIKTVLSIQHGKIPKHLHFETPNPHIAWDRLPVEIVRENRDWSGNGRRLAGVSAFGMSGTNAHVVIESPPEPAPISESPLTVRKSPAEKSPHLLVLSGRTDEAVQQLAANYRDWLSEHPETDLADVCHSAATGRRHFERRAALVAHTGEEASELLSNLAGGTESGNVFTGQARPNPMVAWQFTGQGSQYEGMARNLYATEPVFKRVMDECAEGLSAFREGNLLDVVFEDGDTLRDTYWTQPALFSIHIALAELMKSWGMRPDVVLGHSLGQYAAACVAGMLDWKDGLWLIHERSRLTGSLPSGGAMAAVFAGADAVEAVVAAHADLSVAARNGSHIVISGPEASIDAAVAALAEKDIRTKKLDTSHAFHSALLDPILDEFEEVAGSIAYRPAECPLVCNVSGEALPANQILDGAYWRRQLREAVQYEKSIRGLADLRCDLLLELGPQPVLSGMAAACWAGAPSALIPSLRKDRRDAEAIAETVARLYTHGVEPDFEALPNGDRAPRRVTLPTYPFQRKRHWGPERPGASRVQSSTRHPLLGEERSLAGVTNESRYENWLAPDRPHWLGDHRVFDDIVFPGAAYVEMAIAATPAARVLEDVTFEMPLMVSDSVCLQTIVRGDEGNRSVEIHSSAGSGFPWTRNVSASISSEEHDVPRTVSMETFEESCPEEADIGAFYEMFAALGIQYGPEFQTIRSLRHGETDVLARLEPSGDHRGYILPPMLLDGALQSLAVGLLRDPDSSLFLPVGIGRFHRLAPVTGDLWSYGRWHETEGDVRTADLTLFDDRGTVVAYLEKLKVRAVSRTALRRMVGSTSERLLYHVVWRQTSLPGINDRPGRWLVVGEDAAWNENVAAALSDRGQTCFQVTLNRDEKSPDEPILDEGPISIAGGNPDHWEAVFARLDDEPARLNGIVWSTVPPPETSPDDDSETYTKLHCTGILELLRTFRAYKIESLDRGLQIVTRNAVSVGEGESVFPDSTQFWGLGRVIGSEYPVLRSRIVDLHDPADSVEALTGVLLSEVRESQIALRSGQTHVPRLVPARAPGGAEGLPVKGGATYLITGGLGMLGRRAAEWLASRGAEHVVLTSRREPTDSTLELIRGIEESGCQVHVMRGDIGDRTSLEDLLGRMARELPPLKGVIHAAGLLEDGLLIEQSWESFQRVLAPKKKGAWLLHQLTAELPLEFFVLYSSAASVMGTPGQANYAMGNAFLDGLAHSRAASGLPALSVNFGPWNEGMAATETVTKAVALQGMTPLTAEEAHEALDRLVDSGTVQATMLDVDWARMRLRYPVEAPSLLDELWPGRPESGPGDAILLEKLREAEETDESRAAIIAAHVQGELQQVLSLSHPPEPDAPLAELGLDSLMAVEFATRLQQQVGREHAIPPTLAFDHPSVSQITQHLLNLIEATPVAAETVQVRTTSDEEVVAVVGLGCRFPGADGPEAYWDLLRQGIDATCELPPDRWDLGRYYSPEPAPGKMYTKRGGFLPDIGEFDADFFGLSEQDASWMDPQHRLLLEVSWQALEDAGIVPEKMQDTQVGVFMGIMSTDYAQLREHLDPAVIDGSQGAGLSHSAGVGRISYLFGFEGPAIAVDTASSSSLVALCQAARSLLNGDCNLALAGGVNAILSPINSLLLCKGGVLSPDGRCKSFSAKADGFGRGEGCGVVALKRLGDAERDGDRILAVIRGTAIGHNGHNGGLTAPSGRSQQTMIRKALAHAGMDPSEVQYLEAHATGTALGDPIEIRAAAEVLGKGRDAENGLLVGSAKANIGHLEAAGGISGFIKVVLSMKHGVIPRQIHFDEPSPHIPWDQIRVSVVAEERPWPNPERQVAGVSALGMTGTNAHVIVEGFPNGYPNGTAKEPSKEALADSEPTSDRSHRLLVFSAKTPAALTALSQRYIARLKGSSAEDFGAVCASAGTGRRHLAHRCAVVARTADEAREKLETLARDEGKYGAVRGTKEKSLKIAWRFSDLGTEYFGMGAALYATEPVVKETLDESARLLAENGSGSLLDALFHDQSLLEKPEWAAPGLFALEIALSRLWRSRGVEPDLVLGEGVGQYAAACAAGMMDWEDGLLLAARRGSLAEQFDEIPESALDEFEAFADAVDHRPPDRSIVCSLTGTAVPVHKVLGGSYWRRHLTETVDLGQSGATLEEANCDVVLEIGPGTETEEPSAFDSSTEILRSLESGVDEGESMLASLAKLYILGVDPNFDSFEASPRKRRVSLPGYPFQRKRYWVTDLAPLSNLANTAPGDDAGAEEELILTE